MYIQKYFVIGHLLAKDTYENKPAVIIAEEDTNIKIKLPFCQQFYASQFSMLLGAFGIKDDASHIMIENGQVNFAPAKQEYYEDLKYYNKLANEGLISKETLLTVLKG